MHLKRKKVKQSKLKISPRGGKKKDIKVAKKKKTITPIKRSKRRNKKLKISSAVRLDIDRFGDKSKYKPMSKWENLLEGHVAFIIGNAPSISNQNLDILKPYFTIGINRIFYIFTPTILMWQDIQMWNSEKRKLVNCKSIKVCRDFSDPREEFLNFRFRNGSFKFKNNPGVLYGTGNTSALAVQLAVSLGCSDVVLIGTDCEYENGKTNFYGNNKDHKSYTLKMCKTAAEWIKEKCPVPVHNCSKNKLWPKENLTDVINKLKPKKMSKKKYIEMFKK